MTNALIELHIPDFEIAKDFYQRLGFKIVWERAPEGRKGYLVMELEGNLLCFWGGNEQIYSQTYFARYCQDTPRGYGVEIVLQLQDLKAFYERVKEATAILAPLKLKPWGLEDFRFADPFGFYIRATTLHEIRDSRYSVA